MPPRILGNALQPVIPLEVNIPGTDVPDSPGIVVTVRHCHRLNKEAGNMEQKRTYNQSTPDDDLVPIKCPPGYLSAMFLFLPHHDRQHGKQGQFKKRIELDG